ncbi:MAG TPA: hypothetical protein VF681_02590 [Abditibacteriaceae bacterium]|jgi:hypothetical protein
MNSFDWLALAQEAMGMRDANLTPSLAGVPSFQQPRVQESRSFNGSSSALNNGSLNGAANSTGSITIAPVTITDFAAESMASGIAPTPAEKGETLRPDAGKADEFVDFYKLLHEQPDATTISLRSRINEMYAEAQANRDHRSPIKRREYTLFLQWLPACRTILLHEAKRSRYDAYAALYAASRGNDPELPPFRAFLDELLGDLDLGLGEGESLLGLKQAAERGTTTAALVEEPTVPAFVARRQAAEADEAAAARKAARALASSPTPEGVALAQKLKREQPTEASEEIERRVGGPSRTREAERRKKPVVVVHPEVQRERAYVMSSGAGGVVALALLVLLRAIGLAMVPSAAAAILAGVCLWLVLRAAMLAGVRDV